MFVLSNMISWSTTKSLGMFFIPILLPKAIQTYKSIINAPKVPGKPIKPASSNVQRGLTLLIACVLIILIKTLWSGPENIFDVTQSRLQIPTDVLFTRLLSTPGARQHGLTASDHVLRSKLVSQEARLLYFAYGPDVLTECIWCSVEEPRSYFYYSIPSTLTYHLLNLIVLAIATSGLYMGKEATIWRRTAIISALVICGLDLYVLGNYNHGANSRATRLEDIETFHWTLRIYRGLIGAALDVLMAGLIYMSSTNRAFVTRLSPAERVENLTKLSQNTLNRLSSVGIVRNTVMRDSKLREQLANYWVHEGRVMSEAMEDEEVVEGVRNALSERVNVARCSDDAGTWSENIIADYIQVAADMSAKSKDV